MTILVCSLSKVTEIIAAHNPGRIISLLDPGCTFPETGPAYLNRHLRLCFDDVHVPTEDHVMPSTRHVDDLLAFLEEWDRTAPLLIHCRAGISRSPATAFIAACLHNPYADEHGIASTLRRVAPLARPNEALVGLADCAMNRNGRMSKAIADTGRGLGWDFDVEKSRPFEIPSTY